ncbi:MAG: ParA family protein [Gammaproteobacteria bacterium]|jgi:chromosome partitioning protein|nr:ParA family protein [Gammaproteobacteria bacterium]
MRTIVVLNAKGGCGKSTISTNLASYYAFEEEKKVVLADYDPQGSSLAWLAARDEQWPAVEGIAAFKEPLRHGKDTDILIIDAPARVHGKELTELVRRADTIIFPVLPSPIDMRAATDYMQELQAVGKVQRNQVKIGIVANRVRENTIIFAELYEFLRKIKIPYVATLRDTQNYIRAEEYGIGIFEMPPSQVYQDLESWEPLIKWLRSKRSMPDK